MTQRSSTMQAVIVAAATGDSGAAIPSPAPRRALTAALHRPRARRGVPASDLGTPPSPSGRSPEEKPDPDPGARVATGKVRAGASTTCPSVDGEPPAVWTWTPPPALRQALQPADGVRASARCGWDLIAA